MLQLIDNGDCAGLKAVAPEVVRAVKDAMGFPALHHCLLAWRSHSDMELIGVVEVLLAAGCDAHETITAVCAGRVCVM